MSPMLAIVIIHLNVGAQKKTRRKVRDQWLLVNGPAGWANSDLMPLGSGRDKAAFCSLGTIPRLILIERV